MEAVYPKALDLLQKAASPQGFLASVQPITNYHRVWARDGVICGLAALVSGETHLIKAFRNTLNTLAQHQHELGTIPSNVAIAEEGHEAVSYGGLAGRVDATTWFVIGVTQYALLTGDHAFYHEKKQAVQKALHVMEHWEFNHRHLMYVPLSGNWADEYITDGYVLYDQLLRIWALRGVQACDSSTQYADKINAITHQVLHNFTPGTIGEHYHERAYQEWEWQGYLPCTLNPAGYKNRFDAFAHALFLLLDLGSPDLQNALLGYMKEQAHKLPMKLLPAFWPPVTEGESDWQLLRNNCKYEFRNYPFEFHNGGSWPMVNGFYGMVLAQRGDLGAAEALQSALDAANARADFAFFENFNSQTEAPNGVPRCTWSAAASVLVHHYIHSTTRLFVADSL